MKNKPHKHAELIKAWADGAEIEKKIVDVLNSRVVWRVEDRPQWHNIEEYRIKPKEKQKVKMWQWVIHDRYYKRIWIPDEYHTNDVDALKEWSSNCTVIQRADWTEIEVEVEQDEE